MPAWASTWSPLRGLTVPSPSPWNTMVGMRRPSPGAPKPFGSARPGAPICIAIMAEDRSRAQPAASPECTPTAA